VVKSSSVLVVLNESLTSLPKILEQKGREDLRNCKYYFPGSFENSNAAASFEISAYICLIIGHKAIWSVSLVQFESDVHIQSVMNIFKAGLIFS
jgi:hypothetical protein